MISLKTQNSRRAKGLRVVQNSDLPVAATYVDSLAYWGIRADVRSRWLNGISSHLSLEQLTQIQDLGFIKSIEPIFKDGLAVSSTELNNWDLSYAADQINGARLGQKKLDGHGVTIGIIDGGFLTADNNPNLNRIFQNQKILGYRDYVTPSNPPFTGFETLDDGHGTEVWQLIAGVNQQKHIQYGLATEASFYLARTDHGRDETRTEEDYWIAAMEWMDSAGVSLINTSLGYNKGFNDPRENYTPDQMDGKSSAISRAAQIATDEKGILIIVSAGNDGNDQSWRILSAPADAEGVMSVGATKLHNSTKMGYSSIGPDFLPYLKPNISVFSSRGTSFSAPIVTGLAACIMQFDSTLTNREIKSVIEKSGNLYPYGNNFVGYGIPDCDRVVELLENPEVDFERSIEVIRKGRKFTIRDQGSDELTVFHKKNEMLVLSQQVLESKNNRFHVIRPEKTTRTTLVFHDRVMEIIWE